MYFSTGFCVLPAPKAGKYTLFFSVLIAFKKRQKRKGKMCFKQMGVYLLLKLAHTQKLTIQSF